MEDNPIACLDHDLELRAVSPKAKTVKRL